MRIAYHSAGGTLYAEQLEAWIAQTLALAPEYFTGLAAPGVLITITDPDYPFALESSIVADDRVTLAGTAWSRVKYSGRSGAWQFSNVPTSELDDWRAWYAATKGFRLPFIVEIGTARYPVVAPREFPLRLDRFERWSGALAPLEAL
jgi:hypothetical protein